MWQNLADALSQNEECPDVIRSRIPLMKIATYNVNSIRRRLPLVLDWIAIHKPDVMCLQETKVQDQDFPVDAFRGAGYQATYRGMKGYNGRHINDPRIHGTASEQSRTVCFHGRDELLADLETRRRRWCSGLMTSYKFRARLRIFQRKYRALPASGWSVATTFNVGPRCLVAATLRQRKSRNYWQMTSEHSFAAFEICDTF